MISSVTSTVKIAALSGAVIAALSAFWYVSGLRADLQQATANVETLEGAVQEQKDAMTRMREEQAQIRQINSELRSINEQQEQEIDSLRNRFNTTASGEIRDFAQLAAQKPGLVENAINNGSADAMRCMELASGAKPTEEERDATTKSQANSICPSLANPNYSTD